MTNYTRIVFTDVKLDDVLAIVILYKHLRVHAPNDRLFIALCGVNDIHGAAGYLRTVLNEVENGEAKNVSYHIGQRLDENQKIPQHERLGMFKDFHYTSVSPFIQFSLDTRSIVYILAQCEKCIPLINIADVVHAPIGFNTRNFKESDFKFFNGVIHVANNCASYGGYEGGKVTRDDKWWAPIVKSIPSIQHARDNAYADTCEFIPKQIAKFGKKVGIDVDEDAIRKDPFSKESLNVAIAVQSAVGKYTYMDRVVNMMKRGDVENEITDAQQMTTWIEEELHKSGNLTWLGVCEKRGFITFGLSKGIPVIASMGLDVALVNDKVRSYFIEKQALP